jgi:protoporphyrinogen/coproporphyrinogen III oxidase
MSALPGISVAVVGAGPAGLAAAHRLRRRGAAVDVYEAAPRVGGRTRTDVVDGWRIDAATQLYGSTYTAFLQLLREAGAADLCVRAPGRDALWRRGRAHEVVYGSVTSMLASGALPLTLKLRMGASYLPFLQRHADTLHLDDLGRAAAAGLDAESIGAWGAREMGPGFVDLLAAPMLATLYGALPDEVSAGFYHALARQGTSLQVLALRGGASVFCDAVAAALTDGGARVHTGRAVGSIRAPGDGVELSGDGWRAAHDAVVVAVPPAAARDLVGETTPAAAEWLADVWTRPAVSLALMLERPVGVRWFGLSFARGEARDVGAACVGENKGAALVPEGRGLLTVFAAPEASERLLGADAETLSRALLPELRRYFPRLDGSVTGARAFGWREGWTPFAPGHLERIRRFGRGEPEGGGRVVLAGDYLVAPTVEGAVVSGLRAAERVVGAVAGD